MYSRYDLGHIKQLLTGYESSQPKVSQIVDDCMSIPVLILLR